MCRTVKEIRESDFTCIALDEYITFRRKQINGDKESLAYFDVIRTESEIANRIDTIQTREDTMIRFDEASEARGIIKDDVQQVKAGLKIHLEECNNNPSLKRTFVKSPFKVIGTLIGIFAGLYILFETAVAIYGLDTLLKAAVDGWLLP